ncbi:MAG: type I-B CRISPR-associated endonuclease Cas1b [Ignavibacterium sp.]|nr:type I-B CRISPR-associated endonuclease Cas1b [Ignavibacterium sp.]MDW8376449.1 type I-B CRISPR-associated endonuclease Cas1b [Ignavibacteriales bacterium]
MKNNIYIFSNTILSRKDNSILLKTIPNSESIHQADIFEDEIDGVILPPSNGHEPIQIKHLPAESIDSIYSFGEVKFNTQFFKCLSNYGITVNIFNYYGQYVGSFLPINKDSSGKIHILQYKSYCDESDRLYVAKAILITAIKNILANLKSYLYSGNNLENYINQISSLLEQMRFSDSIENLMGIEGNARNIYYQSWGEILKQESDFEKRIKHPPIGMINSLISFGNSLLYAVCINEIFRTKLTPYVGFIHETGDGKHPLVYDIAEIFKPVIVDKVIFRVINLNMITKDDFKKTSKGYYLKDEARKIFVEEFEKRLSSIIHHNRLNRRISYRSIIRMECYNLINYLSGKLNSYEPYRAE